jgi:hypothetical protein
MEEMECSDCRPDPPSELNKGRRKFGAFKGRMSINDELFAEPLPEDKLAQWEGSDPQELQK